MSQLRSRALTDLPGHLISHIFGHRQLSSRQCRPRRHCVRRLAFYQQATPNHFQARAVLAAPKRSWSSLSCVVSGPSRPGHAARSSACRNPVRSTELRALDPARGPALQIYVHPGTFHAPSNSRNLAFSGRPSICFAGRVRLTVGVRCPRPAVVPITCRFAARHVPRKRELSTKVSNQ